MSIKADFDTEGVAHISTGVETLERIAEVENELESLGSLFRVFLRHPFWKPLGVDLSRPPGRSGGIGTNSLHIDCVNMESPPPAVALHCLRADPAGGGISTLAPTDTIRGVSPSSRAQLAQAIFDEGEAYDLQLVGKCLSNFPVLSGDDDGWVRWSGRLLERSYPETVMRALEEGRVALTKSTRFIKLEPGDTVIVNQRRFLHGRTALGDGQAGIPPNERRLIVQCYIDPSRQRRG